MLKTMAALAAIPLLFLTGCSEENTASSADKPASSTAPTTPSPTESPTPTYKHAAVAAYIESQGIPFSIDSEETDEHIGVLCAQVDGVPMPSDVRKSMIKQAGTAVDGKALVEALEGGCRAAGLAHTPSNVAVNGFKFAAEGYKFPRIAQAMHDGGFDGWLSQSEDVNAAIRGTCEALDDEERGSSVPRAKRAAWNESLTAPEPDGWNWTDARATAFVDTMYKACYDTGVAVAYVPWTLAQENAVDKAQSYLEYSGFSYTGLVEQLEYEGFSNADSRFGAENAGADWMSEAAEKAESYMEYSSFSRQGLIDQLLYEGFTPEQAAHGAQAVGY